MNDACQHCGTRLPPVRDAFCIECGGDLSEPAAHLAESLPAPPPPSREQTATDHGKAVQTAVAMSVAVYAIFIMTLFAPDVRIQIEQAFAWAPFGLPAIVFAALLQTVLYVPIPRAFYHCALIWEQARRDGRLLIGFSAFRYLAQVDQRHPHLARSRHICFASLIYFMFLVVIWTAYCSVMRI